MSRNAADSIAGMASIHLINKRSFEVFEEKIDSRFEAVKNEVIKAVILEVTVDVKGRYLLLETRLNRFYWICCSPALQNEGLSIKRLCAKILSIKTNKSFDDGEKADQEKAF